MENLVRFLLENFTLTLFVVGLVAAAASLLRKPRPLTSPVLVEAGFSYFILCSIALSYLYNFVAHVFYGEAVARFIGWADSPFQREVGFASLGFAVVGFLAFRGPATHDTWPRWWRIWPSSSFPRCRRVNGYCRCPNGCAISCSAMPRRSARCCTSCCASHARWSQVRHVIRIDGDIRTLSARPRIEPSAMEGSRLCPEAALERYCSKIAFHQAVQ